MEVLTCASANAPLQPNIPAIRKTCQKPHRNAEPGAILAVQSANLMPCGDWPVLALIAEGPGPVVSHREGAQSPQSERGSTWHIRVDRWQVHFLHANTLCHND